MIWLAGRLTVIFSAGLPVGLVAAIDLAFRVFFALAIAHEFVAGRNWHNMIVLRMLAVFPAGNTLFHWEAARGDYAAQGAWLRLGLGAGIMMIAVIGGRVVPSFTRNWLAKRRSAILPVPPMQKFDKAALVALLVALAMMTRATLGHTGQALTAGAGTVTIYAALILSVLARVAAGLWPEMSGPLHTVAGLGWIAAFGGFAVVYGALLLRLPAAKRL